MSNISHLHEDLGQVIGLMMMIMIILRCNHHHLCQLMDSGCRLRARAVGRRQQRAAPAWESTTSFASPAFCTFLLHLLFVLLNHLCCFAPNAFCTFLFHLLFVLLNLLCCYGWTVLVSEPDTKNVNIVYLYST